MKPPSRCSWLLNNSADDANAKSAVAEMTLKEVEYCLAIETRSTAIRMLKARLRKLKVRFCRSCGCTDGRACPGGCSWVEDDLCSACKTVVK